MRDKRRAIGGWVKFFMPASLATRRRLGRAFIFPTDQKYERDAGADGGVGDVEGGKFQRLTAAAPLHEKIKEVHHRMARGQQPVGEIANDAAENEAESEPAGERVCVEMVTREIQHEQRHQRDGGQDGVVAGELAEGRAGVFPVDQVEKSRDDDLFVAYPQGAQHHPFGDLVKRKNENRQRDDEPAGFGENGSGGGHGQFAAATLAEWLK